MYNKEQLINEAMNFLPQYEYEDGYSYEPTREGLSVLFDEWYANKCQIIADFKKHPQYNGKYQIVLTENYHRDLNFDGIKEFCVEVAHIIVNQCVLPFDVGSRVTMNGCEHTVEQMYSHGMVVVSGIVTAQKWMAFEEYAIHAEESLMYPMYTFFIDYMIRCAEQFASKDFTEYANSVFPWLRVHNGQKVSRIIGKICKYYGIDKCMDHYQQKYTKFCDAINPLKVERWTILSVHPIDYWTMSFGNDWQSCHTIDKTNVRNCGGNGYTGMYSAGTESYMLDNSSIVVYIVDKRYNGNEFELQPKLSRQMFHLGEDKIVQGRLYPQDNDTGSEELYKSLRETVQRVMSECEGANNLWKNVKGTEECDKVILSYGNHYRDYLNFDNCNVSYRKYKDNKVNEIRIQVGSCAICPTCGEEHDLRDCIVCNDCQTAVACDWCNERISANSNYITSYEGNHYCDSYCAERDDVVYIPDLGEWMSVENECVYYSDFTNEYFYDNVGDHICTEDSKTFQDDDEAEAAGYIETDDGYWYPSDDVCYCEHCDRVVHYKDFNLDADMCDDCFDEMETE